MTNIDNDLTLIGKLKLQKKIYLAGFYILLITLLLTLSLISSGQTIGFVILPILLIIGSSLLLFAKRNENMIEKIRYKIVVNNLHEIARKDINLQELAPELVTKISTDLAVNLMACEAFPEWCAVDAIGNIVEIAACRQNKNSEECKVAKSAIKTVEFVPEKFAKVISSASLAADRAICSMVKSKNQQTCNTAAKNIIAPITIAGVSTITGLTLGGTASVLGFGQTAAALTASAGPIGLGVAALAIGVEGGISAYEACKNSKKCSLFFNNASHELKETIKNERRALILVTHALKHNIEKDFSSLKLFLERYSHALKNAF